MSETTETILADPVIGEVKEVPTLLTGGDSQTIEAGDGNTVGEEPKAPEAYTFDLPEGMSLDKGLLEAVEPALREANLTNAQANTVAKAYAATVKAQEESYLTEVNGWATQVQADPELGGKNFADTAESARQVMAKFGTPALKDLLNSTGYGNHPELVRFVSRIGKSLMTDKVVDPDGSGAAPRTLEDRMYGNKP